MTNAGLRKLTRIFLLLITTSTVYLDYWEYSRLLYQDPDVFNQFLRGEGNAPQQYRIGVLQAADLLHRLTHLHLRHAVTLIDLVSALCAVFLLLSCLERMAAYRDASPSARGVACAVYVALVQFYFGWALWFQRPETFTTALSVALLFWLLMPRHSDGKRAMPLLLTVATLLLALLQAMVRADVVITLEAGVLLFCLLDRSEGIALSRWSQAALSLAAIFVAGGTQFYIMHVVYPHATYGDVQMFQLKLNLRNPIGFIPFVLFMTPYMYLWRHVRDTRMVLDRSSLLLLPGSLLFLGLWCVFGRVDEVRIMLPYTLALAPFLATVVMQKVSAAPRPLTGLTI